ncbi:E3 ubiquitin-protein ligase rnf146 [Tachysurus vachellii]|uniref:E3 ubiquitin-protein ligase rnf146 n=1 Tax=Tachysurus vachellii TaxID=175792 RepID=UPI00296AAE95|nr:E3 ubiquitin-protein ligase rnf146 [Tachysurus vachellii]XP_060750133.1 E3 ubiquitin-protein ligase rnf146 [Tachysurus vachellii]
MASCGEVNHSIDALTSGKKVAGVRDGSGSPSPSPPPSLPVPECAICLQSCVHPVRLPCGHVFCFLCVKGASWHSKRCALCRQEVPEDFLDRPTLLSPEELKATATGGRSLGGHAWYYEGCNGWWQYDERTSRELEEAYREGKKSAEMLIAGFLYVADLENMVQYRRNEHGRRRRMKRDAVNVPKKGVAGLRLDPEPTTGSGSNSVPGSGPVSPAFPVPGPTDSDVNSDGGVTESDVRETDVRTERRLRERQRDRVSPGSTDPTAAALSQGSEVATSERENSADGADISGAIRFQATSAPPPIRPPVMLGGDHDLHHNHQLIQAIAQLHIGRSAPEEEQEQEVDDDDNEEDSVAAPDPSGYESDTGTSEDEEGENDDEGRRQRLQRMNVGVRSRSPDGQCTVTEV